MSKNGMNGTSFPLERHHWWIFYPSTPNLLKSIKVEAIMSEHNFFFYHLVVLSKKSLWTIIGHINRTFLVRTPYCYPHLDLKFHKIILSFVRICHARLNKAMMSWLKGDEINNNNELLGARGQGSKRSDFSVIVSCDQGACQILFYGCWEGAESLLQPRLAA